jgi:flagellar assembly protein FliH
MTSSSDRSFEQGGGAFDRHYGAGSGSGPGSTAAPRRPAPRDNAEADAEASATLAQGAARLAQRIAQRDAELKVQRAGHGTGTAASAGGARVGTAAVPPAPPSTNPYARFIPREELGAFAAWQPDSFESSRQRPNLSAQPDPEQQRLAAERAAAQAVADAARERERRLSARAHELRQARDDGYQEGQRDTQAAFETFRQGFAAQAGGHVDAVLAALQQRLVTLEQDLAQRVAGIALEVAQQVVRSELMLNPAQVVAVTQEALSALLVSARHITVRLNPDDFTLVAEGCAELIAVRGARLVSDRSIERGGCLVDSDIGLVDATVASRWQRASAALGRSTTWSPGDPVPRHDAQPTEAPYVPDPAPLVNETSAGALA